MNIEYLYLYTFVLALLASLLVMPLLIRYSGFLRLTDDPSASQRKLHSKVMPRSGGLGIIFSAATALLIILPIDDALSSFLLGALVITCFGLLDDLVELSPAQKIAGQAIGVIIAMVGGMVIHDVPMLGYGPAWFSYGITFFFVMGVINGVNFSDGMDGLAAGTTLMALVVLFTFAMASGNTQVASVTIAISAALIGFLRFNTHPATIFMGDAGSQFLGFTLAWLSISVSQSESSPLTTLIPLLILGIPVMDILQVVPVRIKKKLPLPGPDKEHFHHQIAKFGFYHYEVVTIIYMLQGVLLAGAYLFRFANDTAVLAFYLAFATTILGTLFFTHRAGWQIRKPVDGYVNRRNRIFRKLGELHPYSGKFYGLTVSLLLIGAALTSVELDRSLLYLGAGWAVLVLAIKVFSRNLWPVALGRLATYTATAFAVYGMSVSIHSEAINWAINSTLMVLAVLLAVSIRTTRREYFWLTPLDLLVLLFVVTLAPQLPQEFNPGIRVGEVVFRTMILLYACEYVLARGDQAQQRLTNAAVLALLALALHLL